MYGVARSPRSRVLPHSCCVPRMAKVSASASQRLPSNAHRNVRCICRRLYLSATAEQDRLTLLYYGELQRLRLRVRLPPMAIPINPVRHMLPAG